MDIIFIVEIIGTLAFGMSGALVAIEKDLDYYGIAFFSIITATGGGVVRDILLGNIPTSIIHPMYALISLLAAAIVILFYKYIHRLAKVLQLFDALGLAAFTVIGAEFAINNGVENLYGVATMAVLTGTGGGLFRDVFSREIPYVFRKEIYAIASIIGAIVFFSLQGILADSIIVYITFGITLAIRLVSLYFDIHLRHIKKEEE
jgi:uncharacterized membrane protein YeiH